MIIYIDSDYKCHVTDDGTRRAFDVPFFDGKCTEFVDGYRYVPSGERWVLPNGTFYKGGMIAPWKDYNSLLQAQLQYEVAQYESALADIEKALGVNAE